MFWGFSEALDLYSEYLKIFKEQNKIIEQKQNENTSNSETAKKIQFDKQINILLYGANDPRHIIKTMAKVYTHRSQGMATILNFYIVDGCVELVARNMILLGIALENPEVLSLRTKVHLFMDVYGNTMIRPSSFNYLTAKAKYFLEMITKDNRVNSPTPMFTFDKLRYRERDALENYFDLWLPKEKHVFNIHECWNSRVQKLLGVRYDHREGQFDWDLNMILKERGGKQICSQEYRYWRETGIAFTFPEYEYSRPNKTLTAGMVCKGETIIHRGYVRDIQTGPFAAFGLNTNDVRMLKSTHGENEYRSTDVTERNLLELFHELATQTTYEHNINLSRKYGSVRLRMGQSVTQHEFHVEHDKNYEKPFIFIDGIKINFLSTNDILSLQQNLSGQWSGFFDVAFVGHNYFTFLDDSFIQILNLQSLLIFETKLLSTARKEEVDLFEQNLLNYAERNNFKTVINYKAVNSMNSILKFKQTLSNTEIDS